LFGLSTQKVQNQWNPNKNPGNPKIKFANPNNKKSQIFVWIFPDSPNKLQTKKQKNSFLLQQDADLMFGFPGF
jgi:hypothetical protein